MAIPNDPIRHVVVLMLENRSFDQLLGDLHRLNPEIEGIDRQNPPSNPYPGGSPSAAGQRTGGPAEEVRQQPSITGPRKLLDSTVPVLPWRNG